MLAQQNPPPQIVEGKHPTARGAMVRLAFPAFGRGRHNSVPCRGYALLIACAVIYSLHSNMSCEEAGYCSVLQTKPHTGAALLYFTLIVGDH